MELQEYPAGTSFSGVIGRTIEDSSPAWPQFNQAREGTPNVLFIVLDDLGFGQLGSYGAPIRTPNLDAGSYCKSHTFINSALDSVIFGLVKAAAAMNVSYRHAKRLAARFRQWGAAGLIHGNRGRAAANRLSPALREKILALSAQPYALFNDTHFTEQLAASAQIPISCETVRKLRRAAGIAPKGRAVPNTTSNDEHANPKKA